MKKKLVLGALFVLPIVVYLFFASGVYNFAKLPVLTANVSDIDAFATKEGQSESLNGKISILCFLGDNSEVKKTNAFNLHEKIYKRFGGFNDLQFIMLFPDGTNKKVEELMQELGQYSDVSGWKLLYGTPEELQLMHSSLKTGGSLDSHSATPYAYIIDTELNLRGRTDDEDYGKLYGYDATSVADLNNKMIDDVKVILEEYRLALKKYDKTSTRDSYLKKTN